MRCTLKKELRRACLIRSTSVSAAWMRYKNHSRSLSFFFFKAFGKVISLVGRHCCLRCSAIWVVTLLRCSSSPINFILQPQNPSPVRPFSNPSAKMSEEDNTENFSHNEHQSEGKQRRDETRVGGGKIPGVCAATAEESLCCEELRFLSAAVRGKNTDQTIVVWINVFVDNSSDISIRRCCALRIYIYYGDVQKSALTRCWWFWLWWQTQDGFKVSKFGAETTKWMGQRPGATELHHYPDCTAIRELTFPNAI